MKEELYGLANHIAGAKGGLPQEWQDWANEIETDLRKLANRDAQPVAWASTASLKRGDVREVWPNGEQHKAGKLCITALYTAPPAPAVPEAISTRQAIIKMESHEPCDSINVAYKLGWNACRAAMLAQPVSGGYKLVPVEPTAEMINAALASGALSIRTVYRAMLAAAPEGGNDHDTRR